MKIPWRKTESQKQDLIKDLEIKVQALAETVTSMSQQIQQLGQATGNLNTRIETIRRKIYRDIESDARPQPEEYFPGNGSPEKPPARAPLDFNRITPGMDLGQVLRELDQEGFNI